VASLLAKSRATTICREPEELRELARLLIDVGFCVVWNRLCKSSSSFGPGARSPLIVSVDHDRRSFDLSIAEAGTTSFAAPRSLDCGGGGVAVRQPLPATVPATDSLDDDLGDHIGLETILPSFAGLIERLDAEGRAGVVRGSLSLGYSIAGVDAVSGSTALILDKNRHEGLVRSDTAVSAGGSSLSPLASPGFTMAASATDARR